jgi:hypothetical protein
VKLIDNHLRKLENEKENLEFGSRHFFDQNQPPQRQYEHGLEIKQQTRFKVKYFRYYLEGF